jgi:hypothetical protein
MLAAREASRMAAISCQPTPPTRISRSISRRCSGGMVRSSAHTDINTRRGTLLVAGALIVRRPVRVRTSGRGSIITPPSAEGACGAWYPSEPDVAECCDGGCPTTLYITKPGPHGRSRRPRTGHSPSDIASVPRRSSPSLVRHVPNLCHDLHHDATDTLHWNGSPSTTSHPRRGFRRPP